MKELAMIILLMEMKLILIEEGSDAKRVALSREHFMSQIQVMILIMEQQGEVHGRLFPKLIVNR